MDHNNSPRHLSDVIGQEKIKESLNILIDAAKHRAETLDHLLFCGPSGFGKTTLANVVANEMGIKIKSVMGHAIERAGDLSAILANLRAEILLIEQIETLRKPVVEVLYLAMEDSALDMVIGKGPSARSLRLKLPRFTVIGTTSNLSQVNEQLKRSMFELVFAPYDILELGNMILLFAEQQNIIIQLGAANSLAKYCNGSPDEAYRLLKNVHKYSIVRSNGEITIDLLFSEA